ncbi:DnaJ-domain-containing protein [Neolentinus lepideus HHB14362 ss-1]|uniref:DnaJ-domain-containing protein n=1 Tax=Neolentinus lepideus HHB14362 ss-1 TaxID=1314782 RepID=A0A165NPZ5_9AGAM|nr:DnaJ-domain-containing protein [Neolentinus lepideus HHB14362 ss-1]
MAPSAEEEIDPYELVGVTAEATEAEIRKAYRQKSLKVHPDRNPDLPDAAKKFHELTQAYELLLDPLRRMAIDAKLRLKAARKERYAAYDSKRKAMVEDLEERERAFKKARVEKEQEEIQRWRENERIMDEGRRMREERMKDAELRDQEVRERARSEKEAADGEAPPALGSLDTTVKLKYPLSKHPTLTTPDALSALLSPFGPTDAASVVLSMKPSKKHPDKPPKFATALVPFKQIGDAFGAVCASGRKERGLGDVEVTWAEGREPEILGWLKKMGKLGGAGDKKGQTERSDSSAPVADNIANAANPQERPAASPSAPFSTFPSSFPDSFQATSQPPKALDVPALDFESITLMRMRQAERDRLEREIREQEANE